MGSDLTFDVRVDSRDGVSHVAVIGELDMATAPVLGEELIGVERNGARYVTLDIANVTFLDSTGLHVLLDAWRQARRSGQRLQVVGASASVRRLCHITGTAFILDASATDADDQGRRERRG